jgi:hypothetical protein
VEEANNRWVKEPVELATIGVDSLERVLKNSSKKLYLIHVWAMSSEPSYTQFPQFEAINRMYRDRDFEFITICVDDNAQQSNALALLRMQHASNTNYMVDSANRNTMIKAVHAEWNGELPYTIVVEPGGEIVYAQQGIVDPALLKKTIVNNHLLGKYP